MTLDIDIEDWPGPVDWVDLAERAGAAAEGVAPELANARLSASVLLTGDEYVRTLNREWRAKDQPTNVLSFPMLGRDDLLALSLTGAPEMLGDVALAYDICAREAQAKGIPVDHHAAHLLVHGFLHLAGLDHIDDAGAEAMEALETMALASMGIANPYWND